MRLRRDVSCVYPLMMWHSPSFSRNRGHWAITVAQYVTVIFIKFIYRHGGIGGLTAKYGEESR